MNILVTGQTTLHRGRMEFGNIGNYYIIEPFFQQLRTVFPDALIKTTLQFSSSFCERHRIVTLPMELYFDFNNENNFTNAKAELAMISSKTLRLTPYLEAVDWADIFIDLKPNLHRVDGE